MNHIYAGQDGDIMMVRRLFVTQGHAGIAGMMLATVNKVEVIKLFHVTLN